MFGSVSGTPTRPLFKTINIVKVCLTRQLHSRRAGKKWEAMAKKISQPEFGIVSFWRPRCLPDQLRKRMVLRPPQSLHSGLSFSQEAKHRRAQTYKRTRRHRPTRARTLPQKHTSELALARAAALSTSPAPARPPAAKSLRLPAPTPFLHSPSPGGNTPQTPNNEDLCDADGGWGPFTTSETQCGGSATRPRSSLMVPLCHAAIPAHPGRVHQHHPKRK